MLESPSHQNFAKTGPTLPPAQAPVGVYKPYLINH